MDDIEAVIKAAEHMRYGRPPRSMTLNKLSLLSEPKSDLKKSIMERISFLASCYVSLATFVDDDDVEFLLSDTSLSTDKKKLAKVSRIYKKVLKDMEAFKAEIREFDPFELPTDGSRDALDS